MSPKTETMVKDSIASIPPFVIEADHPRNADLLLQSIPNCRLRSTIKASRTTIANPASPDNEPVIPKDQARHLGSLPTIPGMLLSVNPTELAYKIVDPLYENEALCKRIQSALNADDRNVFSNGIAGVPPLTGKLDKHRMKTLCREIVYLLGAGEAVIRKGLTPSMEDVAELPGKFLLNPGSRVPNNQPMYEEDLDAYVDNLQKTGG